VFLQYARNWYAIATAVRAKYPHLPLVLGCETQEQMHAMVKVKKHGLLGGIFTLET